MNRKQTIQDKIRAQYPDVYRCPGIGWCGPNWREAEAMDKAHQLETWKRLDAKEAR